MKASKRCCQTCDFFDDQTEDKGTCHFNAPFPSMKSPMMNEKFFADATITWPQVMPDDWCGRFKEGGNG
ncbi:MAG: hypothetical protein GY809_32530 [Planctomycetes bacterium]|nr:hypothetical protein [Planctomycetota bacterium]